MNNPRITLVASSCRPGGAERVMSIMANHWAAMGWHIHLLSLDDGRTPFYPFHSSIMFRSLDLAQPLGAPPASLFRMYKRIHELRTTVLQTSPEVILSFNDLTNIVTLLATRGMGVPVIVGERSDPHMHRLKLPWRLLRPWAYRQADCVVTQTQHALDYFSSAIRIHGRVIPNAVRLPEPITNSSSTECQRKTHKVVLAMGRLAKEKNFMALIQAFAVLAPRYPTWNLEIWGEGPERDNLEMLVNNFNLCNRITLPGTTKSPNDRMRKADLFVLSSLYEGFPNVLGEAMACGLPVISFNCPSGPSELICDGTNGILVPPGDTVALAAAMDRLINNELERQQLALRAPEVIERFRFERIMALWTNLVQELRCGQ